MVVDITFKNLETDIEDINEDLDSVEDIVESLGDAQRQWEYQN